MTTLVTSELLSDERLAEMLVAWEADANGAWTEWSDHEREIIAALTELQSRRSQPSGEPVAWGDVQKAYDILCSGNPPHSARESNARRALRQAIEASPPIEPAGVTITDEMVGRAMKAFAIVAHDLTPEQYHSRRDNCLSARDLLALDKSIEAIRAALTAALEGK